MLLNFFNCESILTSFLLVLTIVLIIFLLRRISAFDVIIASISKALESYNKDLKDISSNNNESIVDTLVKVSKNSVYAVEQISKVENMTSEEKKQLAREYFVKTIRNTLNMNIELDENTIDGFIESSVYFLNTLNNKYN